MIGGPEIRNPRRLQSLLPDRHPDVVARLERECELYLQLLNLGLQDDLAPFLEEALRLITEVVGAHQGYLEVAPCGDAKGGPHWWAAHGLSELEVGDVRSAISRGIIAEAMTTGKTIVTRSASHDQRFQERRSVREGRIEAVVCAPIGGTPPLGAVYLQRRINPGPFSEEDRSRVELFARHIAPYADRLLARAQARSTSDPTQPFREKLRLNGFIGRSEAIASVLREVALIAPLEIDVLLTGASGTGKSQIARIIHENSSRVGRPFVELNCASIPESLLESELFGALPGAHSTASRRIDGKLAAADRGTLLLDEVGEIPPSAQAKLLQLLQERSYYPLGAAHPVRADLCIIAATNTNLEAAVKEGRFREDLFYRLNVLPIRLPSLVERKEDITDLARYFCSVACTRHRLPHLTLSPHLLNALEAAEWPGNVRQLANAIEAAAIRAAGTSLLQIEQSHVFPSPEAGRGASPARPPAEKPSCNGTFQEATRRFQAQLVRQTLEDTGWNVVEAARRLDVARSHLYTLVRVFGIERIRR